MKRAIAIALGGVAITGLVLTLCQPKPEPPPEQPVADWASDYTKLMLLMASGELTPDEACEL